MVAELLLLADQFLGVDRLLFADPLSGADRPLFGDQLLPPVGLLALPVRHLLQAGPRVQGL